MTMYEIISKKRRGEALSEEEIRWVIRGFTDGAVPDYQMSALAMAICFQGMDPQETAILTDAMARSGDTVDLSRFGTLSADKHSTGGVGDKTTLVVAPLAASLGAKVAKMSGRGLGHTGGTVDKLESIPGFRSSMHPEELLRQCERIGIAVAGQSGDLAPADKKLYALRDVTATVDSIPLICSSIMSKKLAEGAHSIVLDVKVGSGAFAKTEAFARQLAGEMIAIGKACGRNMTAVLSNMDQPLGWAVGNALEVREAVRVLQGEDIPDLRALCVQLAGAMLSMSRGWSMDEAKTACEKALDDGSALRKFREWISAQGGDARVADDPDAVLPRAPFRAEALSPADGYIAHMDTQAIGSLCVQLGAGRKELGDEIDHSAGLVFTRKTGAAVTRGQAFAAVYGADRDTVERTARELADTLQISEKPPVPLPLVIDVLR